MITAELRMDNDYIDSITIDGNMAERIVGRTTTTLTLEITVDGVADMPALSAAIALGHGHGRIDAPGDAEFLRRIADALGGSPEPAPEPAPEPRVRRRRTGVRNLDVG